MSSRTKDRARGAALLALAVFTAACQAPGLAPGQAGSDGADASPPAQTPAEADTCNARTYGWLVGEPKSRIPAMPADSLVRVVCTTCPMTLDFNAARLNIFYDEKTGVIGKLSCG